MKQLSINFLLNYPLLWLVKTRLKICIIFHPLLNQPSAIPHLTCNEFHPPSKLTFQTSFKKVLNYWNHCIAYHLHGLNQKHNKLMDVWTSSYKLARDTLKYSRQIQASWRALLLKSLLFRVRKSELNIILSIAFL